MISVVIPPYNAEKTIRRCLDSVINQSVPVEIILADDESTHGTIDTVADYAEMIQMLSWEIKV